jgi:hypothetical protein
VTVEQGVALFHCRYNGSDDIIWRVNGTSPTTPNINESRGFNYSSLTIASLLNFNGSTIECGAIFYNGSPLQFTPPILLLVQGLFRLYNNGDILLGAGRGRGKLK